jgi:hypothetical protein
LLYSSLEQKGADVCIELNFDCLTLDLFEMSQTLRTLGCGNDDFDIFGEKFRQPERNVGLLGGISIQKLVNALDDNDNLVIYVLGTVNDKLLFNFSTADIQPVGKKLSDVLLQKVHILF